MVLTQAQKKAFEEAGGQTWVTDMLDELEASGGYSGKDLATRQCQYNQSVSAMLHRLHLKGMA